MMNRFNKKIIGVVNFTNICIEMASNPLNYMYNFDIENVSLLYFILLYYLFIVQTSLFLAHRVNAFELRSLFLIKYAAENLEYESWITLMVFLWCCFVLFAALQPLLCLYGKEQHEHSSKHLHLWLTAFGNISRYIWTNHLKRVLREFPFCHCW